MMIILAAAVIAAVVISICVGADHARSSDRRDIGAGISGAAEQSAEMCASSADDAVRIQRDAVIAAIGRKYQATAVQAAVIKDGVVSELYNWGYSNRFLRKRVRDDTVFRIASLSKPVTVMAVLSLCERGEMQLDANIEDYLGYRVRSPKHPDTILTVRMLMVHTSALIDSPDYVASKDAGSSMPLERLLNLPSSYSEYEPGTHHQYSNLGIAALAAAAEKIVGCPLADYIKREMLEPIGTNGAFLASQLAEDADIANMYGSGGLTLSAGGQRKIQCRPEPGQTHHIYQGNLTISAGDYAKILCVLINGGVTESGQRILSQESVDLMLSEQMPLTDTTGWGLGLGMSRDILSGRTVYYHNGNAFGMRSGFIFDRDNADGVVVLTTGARTGKNPNGLHDICSDIVHVIYE